MTQTIQKKSAVKAYKVFDPDWKCRGFQFEVGKTFKHEGRVEICSSGFHACLQAADCFSYYSFDTQNKVAEVLLWGDVDERENGDDTKICARNIQLVREIDWQEVLNLVNTGKACTGLKNSGDCNSGDCNSGNGNQRFFCSENQPVYVFDLPTDLSLFAVQSLMPSFWNYDTSAWVSAGKMMDEEKQHFTHYETTGGYLKTFTYKEMYRNGWAKDSDENKLRFFNLPNFTLDKFEQITGIDAKADFKRLVK